LASVAAGSNNRQFSRGAQSGDRACTTGLAASRLGTVFGGNLDARVVSAPIHRTGRPMQIRRRVGIRLQCLRKRVEHRRRGAPKGPGVRPTAR
jgi:hypothetical protein